MCYPQLRKGSSLQYFGSVSQEQNKTTFPSQFTRLHPAFYSHKRPRKTVMDLAIYQSKL